MDKPLVSIVLSVYNGANKIYRALDSIKNQTYSNFELVIVDNGSTDNVKDVVEEYIKQVDFSVKFLQKEFAGRQTGVNLGIENAVGKYILTWSADDELLPEAIEQMVNTWLSISDNKRDEYWAVVFRCVDQIDKKMVGDLFPENINSLSRKKQIKLVKHTETVKMMCADKLKRIEYRFPEPKEVYHLYEGIVWKHLECDFDTYYTNNIARVYYIENDSTSADIKKKNRRNINDMCWYYRHIVLNPEQSVSKIKKVKYAVLYTITTEAFKREYPYYCKKERNNMILQIQLFLLKIPCYILGRILEKRWKIQE